MCTHRRWQYVRVRVARLDIAKAKKENAAGKERRARGRPPRGVSAKWRSAVARNPAPMSRTRRPCLFMKLAGGLGRIAFRYFRHTRRPSACLPGFGVTLGRQCCFAFLILSFRFFLNLALLFALGSVDAIT